MYANTTLFELSETVFGILVSSRGIKVVVEPTLRNTEHHCLKIRAHHVHPNKAPLDAQLLSRL